MRDQSYAMWVEQLEQRQLMSVGSVTDRGAVRIETNLGRMTVLLTPQATPLTVDNFLQYVDQGLYANTLVHRSVPGFVIQAGGYQASGSYSHIQELSSVPNEFDSAQAAANGGSVNVRGTIAMAKLSDDPDSATSEWFINLADNSSNLDTQDGGFTPFGTIIAGGMHTADAIAALTVVDASNLNSAFTALPVIQTAQGPQAVIVKSATAQRTLPVTLDSTTKTVTWTDENGATATISLSQGTADLLFVGGSNMTYVQKGNQLIISGKGIQLSTVSTHSTTPNSVLTITSRGGKTPAHVGDIATDAPLKQISASKVWLDGDINAAGSIGRIDLAEAYRSTFNIAGTGGLTLNIQTAVDTSINTTQSLKTLTVKKWTDDGQLPTSIIAAGIGTMTVTGNFSSNISSTGSLSSAVINGNLGTLGASTWSVTGNIGTIKTRAISSWTVQASSLSTLTATGAIQSSTIAANGSIGTVTASSLKGTTLSAGGWNGSDSFSNSGGAIGKVTLRAPRSTFSNSHIAAVTIGQLHLGQITPSNSGTPFGLTTGPAGILRLDASLSGKSLSLRSVKSEQTILTYFASKKITPGDFQITITD